VVVEGGGGDEDFGAFELELSLDWFGVECCE